jgi:hypothetical protein
VKLTSDQFLDALSVARDHLQDDPVGGDLDLLHARNFAEVIVQVSEMCLIGVPCEKHGGMIHGQEAEELRAGVEQILRNTAHVNEDDEPSVFHDMRKSLIFLLDRIDARDSLAFREANDPPTFSTDLEQPSKET